VKKDDLIGYFKGLSMETCTKTIIVVITLMHRSLSKVNLVLNSVLLFWKLLAFVSLLGNSETFVFPMFALQLKIVLLDELPLLMSFAGILREMFCVQNISILFYYKHDTFKFVR
jgi:hypothetical protein